MNNRQKTPAFHINKHLEPSNSDTFILNILNDILNKGDKTGTNMAYVNYKPAEVKNTGNKFFIQYSFRHPVTKKWIRFKRYGIGENMGLNRIKQLDERVKLAHEMATALNVALAHGYNPFDKPEQKDWTVFQALNLWKINFENKADRKATVNTYTSMVNTYLKKFKKVHHDIKQITRTDIENFLVSLKTAGNLTNTTYNSYLQVTKVFFNYCVASEMLDRSPAEGIKLVKAVVSKHKYFTDEELEKIKKTRAAEAT